MPSYGLTPQERDAILDSWCANTPLLHPMCAVQLHVGPPGPQGLLNASTVGQRQAASIARSSGSIIITGALPSWPAMASNELITGVSLWTDLSAGYAFYTAALQVAEQVSGGDQFTLNTGTIPFTYGLAS